MIAPDTGMRIAEEYEARMRAKNEEIENLQHQIETLREENESLNKHKSRLYEMISKLERDLSNK